MWNNRWQHQVPSSLWIFVMSSEHICCSTRLKVTSPETKKKFANSPKHCFILLYLRLLKILPKRTTQMSSVTNNILRDINYLELWSNIDAMRTEEMCKQRHNFFTDESFHHRSLKLNKQFSIIWMLSDVMENILFCFLNMVFAAVLNKWSYSYGFLFKPHC